MHDAEHCDCADAGEQIRHIRPVIFSYIRKRQFHIKDTIHDEHHLSQ